MTISSRPKNPYSPQPNMVRVFWLNLDFRKPPPNTAGIINRDGSVCSRETCVLCMPMGAKWLATLSMMTIKDEVLVLKIHAAKINAIACMNPPFCFLFSSILRPSFRDLLLLF